jgi:uncharacterized protein YcbX
MNPADPSPVPPSAPDDGSSPVSIAGLHVYPVKSCGGVALDAATLVDTGLDPDRLWMVVDADGEFLSQREQPRMALVQPTIKTTEVVLRAPGMLPLHLPLDVAEQPLRVRIWDDEVTAYTMGATADQWFSTFLGQPARLVRFDPEVQRLSSRRWTGDIEAPNTFSDGYPILVTSVASLAELNRRLVAANRPAVEMARFRPNLVIDGVGPHGEDMLDELRFDTPNGPVVLRLVKPCPRCPMPNVDPRTAAVGDEPGLTLAGYRADPRLDGAISFGMNAVIVSGGEDDGRGDRVLRVGQAGVGTVRF